MRRNQVKDEKTPWSDGEVVEFYQKHRSDPDQVYPSEGHFLFPALRENLSILDFGCASGGFYKIIREKLTDFTYTGLDISPSMIQSAKDSYRDPNCSFSVSDGTELSYPARHFDLVFSFGVLHMTSLWERILSQLWRVSGSQFIFDLRIVEAEEGVEDIERSFQVLNFSNSEIPNQNLKVPYNVIARKKGNLILERLNPRPKKIETFQYEAPISSMASSPFKKVLMTSFSLWS